MTRRAVRTRLGHFARLCPRGSDSEQDVRLGVVVSHPIQYHAPLHRALANEDQIRLRVFYLDDHGVLPTYDPGFGKVISFESRLLDGFEHTFVPNRAIRPSIGRFTGLVNPGVVRSIARGEHDVVLIHGYAHLSDWLAAVACIAWGIPYLLRGESRSDTDIELPRWRRLLKRAVVGQLVRRAAGCLWIGERNRQFYLEYGVQLDRLWPAPYAVDNRIFVDAAQAMSAGRRAKMARDLGLANPSLPIVLFVGKLQPWKRPRDLAHAARGLAGVANVVFVGDGPERDVLEQELVPGAGAVLGFQPEPEIAEWYAAADVLALPSEREPWGLVVNEAMAAGCVPVVSTAVGCVDLVRDIGEVVPVGDPDALCNAIKRVLDAIEQDPGLASAIRERVEAFDVLVTSAGIAAAARSVSAKRSVGPDG